MVHKNKIYISLIWFFLFGFAYSGYHDIFEKAHEKQVTGRTSTIGSLLKQTVHLFRPEQKDQCVSFNYVGDYCVSSGVAGVGGTYVFDSVNSREPVALNVYREPVWYNSQQNKYLYVTQRSLNCISSGYVMAIGSVLWSDKSDSSVSEYCSSRWTTEEQCLSNEDPRWYPRGVEDLDNEFKIVRCEPVKQDIDYDEQDFCIKQAEQSINEGSITGAYHIITNLAITATTPMSQLSDVMYTTGDNQFIYFVQSSSHNFVVIDTDTNYDNGYVAICNIGLIVHYHVDTVPMITDCDDGQWKVYDSATTMVHDDSLSPEQCADIYTGSVCVTRSENQYQEGIYEYDPELTGPWTGPVYVNSDQSTIKYLYRYEQTYVYGWLIDEDLNASNWNDWAYCVSVEKNDVQAVYLSDIHHCLKGDWQSWFDDGSGEGWHVDVDMRSIDCDVHYAASPGSGSGSNNAFHIDIRTMHMNKHVMFAFIVGVASFGITIFACFAFVFCGKAKKYQAVSMDDQYSDTE